MKITVSIAAQELVLWDGEEPLARYPISSGKQGTGQLYGSGQTPLGRHIIRAKIGDGAPLRAVFVGRRATGEVYDEALKSRFPGRDWILTRILWLGGTEIGYNRSGECDTQRRFIYIHGTPYEDLIGKPESHGCLRMKGADLLALYQQVSVGTPVIIER